MRQTSGRVPTIASNAARTGGCRANTGDSKSLPAIRPMSPHPANASRSSATDPAASHALPSFVDPAIGFRASDRDWRREQQHGRDRERWQAQQPLPVSPRQGERRPGQEERHVAAEPGGKLEQLVTGNGIAGKLIDPDQCSRPVARSAAQPRAHRNPLFQTQVHPKPPTGGLEDHAGRAHRQVLFRRADVGARYLDGDFVSVAQLHLEPIRQFHAAEQCLQPVESVVLPREHPQEKIDLGVALEGNGGHRDGGTGGGEGGVGAFRRRSPRPIPVRASDQRPRSVIGTKVVT